MNHSYATYPGVQNVLGASYTLTHGITPSVVSFQIVPQTATIFATGDVVFYHGTTTLTLRDCRADQSSMVRSTDGTLVSFSAVDRRWRWRFGEVYGHYNQRDADGLIVTATEKTPQQLAQLLLDAMGETGVVGVSDIPNNARPECEWVAENPAEALADLIEPFGMVVVLQINGTVAIRQQGIGAALPANTFLIEQEVSSNPPEVPATVRILGGPNRYQRRLELEAVGYDLDGSIKPIDQLSYTPAGGWGKETQFFSGIAASDARALALRDVFRLYRIRDINSPISAPIVSLPGPPPVQAPVIPIGPVMPGQPAPLQVQQPQIGGVGYLVQYLREILPLEKGLVQTGPDANGIRRRRPEAVYGVYFVGNISLEFPRNSSRANQAQWRYPGRFTVEHELGMVRFDEQVVRWDDTTKQFAAAFIELECSFTVRHPDTSAHMRWSYTQATGAASGYGTEVVRREELVWERYTRYDQTGLSLGWLEKTYEAELNALSQYYANGRISQYVTQSGASGKYVGLQAINPDGAIQQVTWEIGGGGCYTSASRLYEPSPYIPPYKERRVNDRQRKQRRADRDQRRRRP